MAARAQRSSILELAVLGLLHEAPLHGYELRKRLSSVLGTFHSISYGSLYPCLKDLVARGWIVEDGDAEGAAPAMTGKRGRIVYKLTAEGKEHFQSGSRSSVAPMPPYACGSSKADVPDSRSASTRCAPRSLAPASALTATPSSFSSTGSRASNVRCGGSTSSSPPSAALRQTSTTRRPPRRRPASR